MCYLISVAALVGVMEDSLIKWYESLILLVLYVAYIILMFNNHRIEGFFRQRIVNFAATSSETSPLLDNKDNIHTPTSGYTSEMENIDSDAEVTIRPPTDRHTVQDEEDEGPPPSPFHVPRDSWTSLLIWILYLPSQAIFYFTIPNCKRKSWTSWYPLTFLMSLLWIGLSSYVLVWMANNVGIAFRIPDVVLGYTVLAIGNSVPDALASVLVARNGFGDMAISNSIGSNIFDILLCLGLPWFLQTTVVHLGTNSFGSVVNIYNTGSLYIALMLFGNCVHIIVFTKDHSFPIR
ncbi:putative sodium/potassium/calcium exchanger 3-like [Apostichopus japonicus]|uniref:Putative sodium/potassium/calcium exchanger 3-like n=1 Tax=Stichopus japonicus TaxID=307972 RepID=A0A2G8LGC4_STIJA|nr:putative sodium/potassium/calcium exchanger 3-like [Apostichopus japonicus]